MNSKNKNIDAEGKLELANEKLIRNEKILIQAYKSLKQKEENLKQLNDNLCTSEEELQAANEELSAINEELFNKNEIINSKNKELKSTLQNLKETQAQLFQTEKMASLGILTSGVAHEINNPLNYIMGAYVGFENYFKENDLVHDKNIPFLLSSLLEGIEKAAAIVQSLNQFSRDSKSNNETCNLISIIDNCLVMLNNQLKHRIEVEKCYLCEDLIVTGNVGKLHQSFINILSNASQAISEKGIIGIKTFIHKGSAIIEISDNGSGISEENLVKITDPFFTTKEPGKGTGLGLSITYSIIQEHGGKLEYESTKGEGTLARIALPLK